MENKAIKVLSLCLIALFALAVIFFVAGLLVEYRKAPAVIESTLSQFTSDVGVASEYYTPGSQQFSEVLRARIASNRTLAVVTITKDNSVIFAYPLSSPFVTQGTNGQPAITASSSLVSVKSKEVLLGDDVYVVNSALYSLQPAVIYSHIRISFLLVLAGTLVAGIALMYLYLTDQKRESLSQEYHDEQMARRLKSRKLDFPEVSPSQAVDALAGDDFDVPEEPGSGQAGGYDEASLPEGAMDFPPPDGDSFQIPQEERLPEGHGPDGETADREDIGLAGQQDGFSEAGGDGLAVQDLGRFDGDTGRYGADSFREEDPEEPLPAEGPAPEGFPGAGIDDLDHSAVAQAQFSQEAVRQGSARDGAAPAGEPSFGIDQALQGMEPPAKQVVKENVAMLDGAEKVQPILPQEDGGTAAPATAGPGPAGLFSPATGFGWESYLEERLDSELIRSAAAEEDIGLMIVRIQGMDRTNPRCNAIYEKLLEFYKFRDLIFEYGQDGFSCIVHGINVDGALELAEEVYVALSKVLEENGMDNEIGIGISTRSFRLVPGRRILMEAEQAVVHAFEDPDTAIVAFRVDPEKYRKYISEYAEEEDGSK